MKFNQTPPIYSRISSLWKNIKIVFPVRVGPLEPLPQQQQSNGNPRLQSGAKGSDIRGRGSVWIKPKLSRDLQNDAVSRDIARRDEAEPLGHDPRLHGGLGRHNPFVFEPLPESIDSLRDFGLGFCGGGDNGIQGE